MLSKSKSIFGGAVFVVVLGCLLMFLLSNAVSGWISHDEEQFLAPGILTWEKGLLPYRDYPLFHVPLLVLLNGALGSLSEYKVLWPRIFAGLCVWLTVCLLAWRAMAAFRHASSWGRCLAALIAGLLLFFAPVTNEATSQAWNHAPPTLFAMVAFCLFMVALSSNTKGILIFFCGMCIGLASGMRLSFLPLLAPFGCFLYFLASDWSQRVKLASLFALGAVVPLIPVICLFAQAPDAFIFGNFQYPKLSLIWRKYPMWMENINQFVDPINGLKVVDDPRFAGRSLSYKLKGFLSESALQHIPIHIAWMVFGLAGCAWSLMKSKGRDLSSWFLLVAVPFVWWGCVAPSRYHSQYYYALTPFLILLAVHGAAILHRSLRRHKTFLILGLCLTAWLSVLGWVQYSGPLFAGYGAMKARHLDFQRMARLTGPGCLLTLEPTIALENGLDVYPEFAVGEFGWRCAHLLPLAKRVKFHLTDADRLKKIVRDTPPCGILYYPKESKIEMFEPFTHLAEELGYVKVPTTNGYHFYVPPSRAHLIPEFLECN
jgi:hypothetical protein